MSNFPNKRQLIGQRRIAMLASSFLQAVKGTLHMVKTGLMKLTRRTDYNRWANLENYLAWWKPRTEKVASLIPNGTRVLEFGAGNRHLESLLAKDCEYIPSDLVDRGPGTVVCDLNKRPLPDLSYLMANVGVFVGVLEYISDLPTLIEWLSTQVLFCVVSYDCIKTSTLGPRRIAELIRRACHGYLSYYTQQELIRLFERNGFACTKTESWQNQELFAFSKAASADAAVHLPKTAA